MREGEYVRGKEREKQEKGKKKSINNEEEMAKGKGEEGKDTKGENRRRILGISKRIPNGNRM